MRDNSGSGKGKNNMRDPTMRDHEGEHRSRQQGRDFTERSAFNIGGSARDRDEKLSPDDRARGETASTDSAAPVDR